MNFFFFFLTGALAVSVPGELAGYWEAHQRFGKLPWADLFKPSIELCEKGYTLTLAQYDGLVYNKISIYNDPTLRHVSVKYKLYRIEIIERKYLFCVTSIILRVYVCRKEISFESFVENCLSILQLTNSVK